MKGLIISKESEIRAIVVGFHYMPETLSDEDLTNLVLVEELPYEAEKRTGYKSILFVNPTTKETWYEYIVDTSIEPQSEQQLKQIKINEINKACDLSISYGFKSVIKDGLKPYYLTADVQTEINANFIVASQGKPVPFKNAEQQICVAWTAQEFLAFYEEAVGYATMLKFYKDGIMRMIELCETVEDYNGIQWGVQLPADIQAEIDATVNALMA